ncbi:MAG: hypothetical protein JHC93_04365 [Parachlamydiales bacterium]|nr:hypothetical protein [Parachlamydiales bacterium]
MSTINRDSKEIFNLAFSNVEAFKMLRRCSYQETNKTIYRAIIFFGKKANESRPQVNVYKSPHHIPESLVCLFALMIKGEETGENTHNFVWNCLSFYPNDLNEKAISEKIVQIMNHDKRFKHIQNEIFVPDTGHLGKIFPLNEYLNLDLIDDQYGTNEPIN